MAVDLAHVLHAASKLIEHYGAIALDMARAQVERVSRTGDHPALDQALMVLSEIERRQAAGTNL